MCVYCAAYGEINDNDDNDDDDGDLCKLCVDCISVLQQAVRMGSMNFNSMEALIIHFSENNLPNKTTMLTKAYSSYARE